MVSDKLRQGTGMGYRGKIREVRVKFGLTMSWVSLVQVRLYFSRLEFVLE